MEICLTRNSGGWEVPERGVGICLASGNDPVLLSRTMAEGKGLELGGQGANVLQNNTLSWEQTQFCKNGISLFRNVETSWPK